MNKSLTALKGVKVGHATDTKKSQGITVVGFDKSYNVAYKTNGGAPRIYDAEVLNQGKAYFLKHAIFVSDGAHAGLEAAGEISKALREKGIGWKMGKAINPSITGACVMSLEATQKPFDPKLGYQAVQNLSKKEVESGNVGAGTGTSVGKFSWTENGQCLAMKSGVGSARLNLGGKAIVCCLTVVNALGNVIDQKGKILAGNRNDKPEPKFRSFDRFANFLMTKNTNTTISIVGTNVKVWQEDLRKVAETATHGQVRAIRPVGTSLDGDTVFAFSTQEIEMPFTPLGKEIGNENGEWWKLSTDIIGRAAAQAVQESIYNACLSAKTIKYERAYKGIIPSCNDY